MTDINVLANGCSSANTIFKADCRDNVDFDLSQCHGHSKGHAFSMDDCSAVCLGRDDCAMIQHHSSGLCWFYDAPDPDGHNGGAPSWSCGEKTCIAGKAHDTCL